MYGYTSNEAIGRPVSFLIPEDRLGEELEILTQIRAGERVDHFETMRRCKHGGLVPVSLRISPLRDDAGAIIGASKIARDISERKRAEEQKDLLVREMAHRVKNLFMVLSSVVALSARSANTADELATRVRARLESLARAHALPLPTPGNPGATEAHVTLKELLGTLLSPYSGDNGHGHRVSIRGCEFQLSRSAITALSLVVHEFATNAANTALCPSTADNWTSIVSIMAKRWSWSGPRQEGLP